MADAVLQNLSVNFKTTGIEAVAAAMDRMEKQTAILRGAIEKVASTARVAFAAASASVMGWVYAGLQGTAQGEYLTLSLQRLSREIAGVFLPIINEVTKGVQAVTAWFRSLSAEQQASVARWTLVGIAIAGVVAFLPGLISSVYATVGAFQILAGAAVELGAALGVGTAGITVLIGALVTGTVALGSWVAFTEKGRAAFWAFLAMFQPVIDELKKLGTALYEVYAANETFINAFIEGFLTLPMGALYAVVKALEMIVWAATRAAAAVGGLAAALKGGSFLQEFNRIIDATERKPKTTDATGEGHQVPTNASRGFEGVQESWKRIAMSTVKDPAAEKQAEIATATKETASACKEIARGMSGLRPRPGT